MSEEPKEPFGASYLEAIQKGRLEIAKSTHNQILDKLWISNGAGAAAVFARAGDAIKDAHSNSHQYLGPLTCFIVGAIFPIIGSTIALVIEKTRIYEMESANSLLDLRIDRAKRPTAQAGLTLWDPRTLSAIISALLLVAGGVLSLCWLDAA